MEIILLLQMINISYIQKLSENLDIHFNIKIFDQLREKHQEKELFIQKVYLNLRQTNSIEVGFESIISIGSPLESSKRQLTHILSRPVLNSVILLLISIDTMILDLGYVEIGKYLNLPTHAYLGISDAKILDMQTGFETGMGTLLAGIKGVNMISGAGMMDFETTQSIQKLVIDNEICGMTHKFIKGIIQRDEPIAKNLIKDMEEKTHLLSHDHTLKWFREE